MATTVKLSSVVRRFASTGTASACSGKAASDSTTAARTRLSGSERPARRGRVRGPASHRSLRALLAEVEEGVVVERPAERRHRLVAAEGAVEGADRLEPRRQRLRSG